MEELKYLTEYYQSYDEEGRLLSQHGQVEFLTTVRYIDRYLQSGMRILEVGAGTGRYSLEFAKRGFQVDAIELVRHNIDILRSKIEPGWNVDAQQGNALDLSRYADDTFDITLVLGPMYHLFNEDDKRQVLREAVRVTKTNGVIFVAYCMNDATILQWGFRDGNILQGLEDGMIDPDTFHCKSNPSDLFEMHRKEDIDCLISGLAAARLHFVATDLATNHMRDVVDQLDEKLFQAYLRYHFSVCERVDMLGITNHSLDVLRKK